VTNRLEGNEKVAGKAIFAGDMQVEGTLVGKILRSKVAHARIKKIITDKAAELPGVFAVITGKDFPDVYGGRTVRDEQAMVKNKIHYIGEAIAAVAAIDEDTAERALALIELELEELPGVFSAEAGLAEDAPLIHENWKDHWTIVPLSRRDNMDAQVTAKKGDIELGFAASDLIIEDTFNLPLIHHAPMEPKASVAYFDRNGKLTVWTGTQSAFSVRRGIARYLQLPLSMVRVVGVRVGGAFGAKTTATIETVAAMLAIKTRRHVKIEMSRQDDFYAANPRNSMKIWVKTGVKKDGHLVARQARILVDSGAYDIFGVNTTSQVVTLITGPYKFEHLDIEGTCVYTTKISCGACRGPGGPEAHFAAETQMDRIARELGIDAFELRRINALEAGDDTAPGQILTDFGYTNVINQLEKAVQEHLVTIPLTPGKARGIGIAGCFWGMSGIGSGATINLNEDGTVTLYIGAVEIGNGVITAMALLVAEELGIPVKNVTVISGDTDAGPYEGGAVGSRTTQDLGTPVVKAVRAVKQQVMSFAGNQLGVAVEELELGDSKIFVKNDPSRMLNLEQVANSRINAPGGGPIIVSVSSTPSKPDYDKLRVSSHSRASKPFFVFGAQAAAVDVDLVTGKVSVCKVIAVHDVGIAVFPQGVEGQIQGGVAMGLGYALSEEAIFDQGRMLNANFLDYRVPTMLDVPEIIPIVVEKPNARVPEDIRGIGEPPTIPTAPAVANAIFDAVGVRINTLPMIPERVFQAIHNI
jgi:CO/xanthine dehydrogenase Mo-binding subunit